MDHNKISIDILKKAIKEAMAEVIMESKDWPRWLPINLASHYSGLSAKTLRNLAKEGDIYATSINGGKLLFDKNSIDEFMLRDKKMIQVYLDRIGESNL